MEEGVNVIIVGLPDSGKTNYIMRLWLALRDNIGAVHSDGVPDDIEYLETGAAELLGGRFAPHTPHEVSNVARIPVSYERQAGQTTHGVLIVPDYSGEVWERVYQKREWPEDWERLFGPKCGCLLFIRADSEHLVPALDWISACKYFGAPEEVAAMVAQHAGESVTPSQVIFVEWLQFFRRAFTDNVSGDFIPRIGIVVSAWDLVPEDQKRFGPDIYVENNFPLLKQFLDTNSEAFDVQFFGVSIVGGDLDDAGGFRATYLDTGPKNAGAVVCKQNGTLVETKDLTYPVAWCLGVDA
jgi:double-GTPase-like protein